MSTILGKISGQMLESNILRDGRDLTIKNTLSSDPVLYFDVNSGRVSLNKDFANSVLDVNDQIKTDTLITNTFQLPSLVINQENITTYSNTLNIVSTDSITLSATQTGNILLDSNKIVATDTDADLVLSPNGTGIVSISGNAQVQADVLVVGDITVDGSIVFGNDIADTIDFNSYISSDLIPLETGLHDIGSDTLYWSTTYMGDAVYISQNIENYSQDISISLENKNYNINLNDLYINGSTITNVLGNLTIDVAGDFVVSSNSAINLPVGTTQQRELGAQVIIDGGSSSSVLAQTISTLDATNDVDYTDTVYHGGKAENDPVMNTADVRFNTSYELFEGYSDLGVVSFGSVYSDDKLTKILTEPSGNAITCLVDDNSIVVFDSIGITAEKIKSSNITIFSNTISSNSDIEFQTQGSGTVTLGNIAIKNNNIQNTSSDGLVFKKTNNGYYKINENTGFVVPNGDTSSRPLSAQTGDTRFNTETSLVETFDGTSYVASWGSENAVAQQDFQDIIDEYSLIFG